MRRIPVPTELSESEINPLEGNFIDARHYEKLVNETSIVEKRNGEPLAILLQNVLPLNGCNEVFPILRTVKQDSYFRIVASGRAKPGTNGVSEAIGYLDRSVRHGVKPCRMTNWTREHVDQFPTLLPFFQAVDAQFKKHLPNRHAAQMARVRETSPDFVLPGTSFTTVTVNKNFRTAVHKDEGDLVEGFGVILAMVAGNFKGGELIFPKYRTAVHFGTQDLLLCDVHEFHANGPLVSVNGYYERLSCVFYYRGNMHRCESSGELEIEWAKRRELGSPLYEEKA